VKGGVGGEFKWTNDNAYIFGRETHLNISLWELLFFLVKNNQKATSQMIVQHVHLEIRA